MKTRYPDILIIRGLYKNDKESFYTKALSEVEIKFKEKKFLQKFTFSIKSKTNTKGILDNNYTDEVSIVKSNLTNQIELFKLNFTPTDEYISTGITQGFLKQVEDLKEINK